MGTEKRQRNETREQLLGDVFWSYASDTKEKNFEGVIMDESRSGMSILTYEPVEPGSLLKISCKNHWKGSRHFTVKWCRHVDEHVYRCGLTLEKEQPQR
jgi:hypothetical protein